MNSSPLPQPAEQKCPNCGTMAPLDGAARWRRSMARHDRTLCPRCGMELNAPSKAVYRGAT